MLGGLLVGVCMWLGFTLQTAGLQLTPAARNSFITSLCLPLTPLCQALMFWRRPPLREVAGVPLALLGVYLITRPSSETGGIARGLLSGDEFCLPPAAPAAPGALPSETRGDLLTLACAVFFAVHIVLLNHYSAAERGESAFKTVAVMQLGVTAGLSAIFCSAAEAPCLHPAPRLWWDVASAGLLASALAFSVFAWSQKHLTATRSAIICASESLWAAITAYLVNGDTMSGTNLLGAAAILAAVTAPDWLPMLVPAWGQSAAVLPGLREESGDVELSHAEQRIGPAKAVAENDGAAEDVGGSELEDAEAAHLLCAPAVIRVDIRA